MALTLCRKSIKIISLGLLKRINSLRDLIDEYLCLDMPNPEDILCLLVDFHIDEIFNILGYPCRFGNFVLCLKSHILGSVGDIPLIIGE
jgi:hypothetical protein